MQKLFLLVTLSLSASTGRPQSIVQLTEQLALDVQQLASIKSTLNDMVEGYDRLKAGYTHIRDVVKDNFNLHKSFLDALWTLSSAVRTDPRLNATFTALTHLVTAWQTTAKLGDNALFTAQERSTITTTLEALLQRCNRAVEELTMVTTDNQLRMSDTQRLAAIDRIAGEVSADNAFLRQLNDDLAIEAARRQREANDITTLKALYGLPD